jgi:predicted PurR-regulated permease PerM
MSTDPTPPMQSESPSGYWPQWDRPTRIMVTVFLSIAVIYAITLLAPVIQMLMIAFVFAFVLFPLIKMIAVRSPLPYSASVALVYFGVLVVMGFLLISIIPAVTRGADSLIRSGQTTYEEFRVRLAQYTPEEGHVNVAGIDLDLNPFILPIRDFVVGTGDPEADLQTQGDDDTPAEVSDPATAFNLQQVLNNVLNVAGTITGTLTSAITSAAGFVTTILLALFVSFLYLLDLPHNQAAMVKWVPPAYHREMALLLSKIERLWNGFFRGQVIIGIIIGLLTWLQLSLMGIPGAVVLALFAAVVSLIPTLGGFIALIPLSIVPLLEGSTVFTEMPNWLVAVLVVVINLMISQIIWTAIAPKILGDILELPVPVIIVGVFIGAALGGILGAFLVAPIMGTIRVLLVYLLNKLAQRDPFPGEQPLIPLGKTVFTETRVMRIRRTRALIPPEDMELKSTGN